MYFWGYPPIPAVWRDDNFLELEQLLELFLYSLEIWLVETRETTLESMSTHHTDLIEQCPAFFSMDIDLLEPCSRLFLWCKRNDYRRISWELLQYEHGSTESLSFSAWFWSNIDPKRCPPDIPFFEQNFLISLFESLFKIIPRIEIFVHKIYLVTRLNSFIVLLRYSLEYVRTDSIVGFPPTSATCFMLTRDACESSSPILHESIIRRNPSSER